MTTRPDFVFESQPANEGADSETRTRWILIGIVALLATAVLGALYIFSKPMPAQGAQVMPAGSFVLTQAAPDGWEPLLPNAGELRTGFPTPMVRPGARVCIGFARIDFGPDDLRPGTARCERDRAANMAPNEVRVLLSIKSGFDTWHFVEAPLEIESITVGLATGTALGPDRIHLSGSTAALRLEHDRDLSSVEWTTQSGTYQCVPDPTAWQSSNFCIASEAYPDP